MDETTPQPEKGNKLSAFITRQWSWAPGYNKTVLTDDLIAAIIVTILLIPQALAYALLAGLPPQVGIYASVLPLIAYSVFGSSRHLSVGPTAVVSLMTAITLATLPEGNRLITAAALALMSGVFLLIMGMFRFGFIINFVSRPVVSAYITGAGLLITISQLKHILGVSAEGTTALALIGDLRSNIHDFHHVTALIGGITLVFLVLAKRYAAYVFLRLGMKKNNARIIARLMPILAVSVTIIISFIFKLGANHNVSIIGDIPAGLPSIHLPDLHMNAYSVLIIPAFIIAVVAFVDSMTIAQTLAARSRSRIDSNKELIGLGVANITAGFSGAYPINGSLSRSAVNYSAGAQTPIAGLLTAGLMALTAVFLTPLLTHLPLTVLAALIIAACFSLMEFKDLWRTWVYSRADGITALAVFFSVLVFGVQWGVLIGVVLAMALHIRTTLRPHMAIVGRFPGTEHYRDADRYQVETHERIKTLRIDESLYYANARYLEDKVARLVSESPDMTDLILMCPAVNRIDASALSSLREINKRLRSVNMRLHFSELHSHVKERLHRSLFLEILTGEVFLSQHEAMETLEPEPDWSLYSDHIDIH